MQNSEQRKMPPAQALYHVIQKAKLSFEWLQELETEWKIKVEKQQDGSLIRKRQMLILDAFTTYISSLFDTTKGVHSLTKSYLLNQFVVDFQNHPVVKQCRVHRHNRVAHQSQKYGYVAALDKILSSNIGSWLNEAIYVVGTKKLSLTN